RWEGARQRMRVPARRTISAAINADTLVLFPTVSRCTPRSGDARSPSGSARPATHQGGIRPRSWPARGRASRRRAPAPAAKEPCGSFLASHDLGEVGGKVGAVVVVATRFGHAFPGEGGGHSVGAVVVVAEGVEHSGDHVPIRLSSKLGGVAALQHAGGADALR